MRQQKPRTPRSRLLRGIRFVVAPAVVCGLLASSAVAQNDIELLLSELTFGQADPPGDQAVAESEPVTPLNPPADEPKPLRDPPAADSSRSEPDLQSEKLRPAAPIRFPTPSDKPPAPSDAPPAPSDESAATDDDTDRSPKSASSKPARSGSDRSEAGESVPSPAPETATPDAVDFHQVFSDPGIYRGEAALAHVAGHRGAHQGYGEAYGHQAPVLPPPSTFLGNFRSRPCNAGVWAGYEHERHAQCEMYHKHLHGQCGCFEPRQKCAAAGVHHHCGRGGCDHSR